MKLLSFPDQLSECNTILSSPATGTSFVTRTVVSAGYSLYSPPQHLIGVHLGKGLPIFRRVERREVVFHLNPGSTLIIPGESPLESGHATETDTLYLHLDPEQLRDVATQMGINPARIHLITSLGMADSIIAGIGQEILREIHQPDVGSSLYLETLWLQMSIHLLRHYQADAQVGTATNVEIARHTRLRKAIDYIHAHLNESIRLSDLAATEALSPFHFSRLFKRIYGVAPHQYVVLKRVEAAQQLLKNSELTVDDVAALVGFANHSHLSRHFKRITGNSPRTKAQ